MRPVNLSADFNDRGGWGRHARNFASALSKYVDVAVCGSNETVAEDHKPDGDVCLSLPREPFKDGTGIALGSISTIPQTVGSPQIFSTVWETSKVPEYYLQRMQQTDQIWIPTEWGRQLFIDAGISPSSLKVVPEGVDSSLFTPAVRKYPHDRFRFVCVGKWETRKATAELVRAYTMEFDASENVELIMHCQNIYMAGLDIRKAILSAVYSENCNPPKILFSRHCALDQLIQLMQQSDAFVLPTRAEAWGLPILEAMSCGLPCIVTDYGGHRAFANDSNSYLIRNLGLCPVDDPINFKSELDWGGWAQPDVDHLRQLMRHVFENRQEALQTGQKARRDAAEFWSWDKAAKKAWSHLSNI